MNGHPVTWLAPAPLWAGADPATAAPQRLRPAILRFASDEFMEQMLGVLDRDPAQLDGLQAHPETWRVRTTPSADLVERVPLPRVVRAARRLAASVRLRSVSTGAGVPRPANQTLPLKLYQPAHQRYYLVTASLVCALPGLPERAVVGSESEQVSFVLRRLLPPTPNAAPEQGVREFAFVKDGEAARWQKVSEEATDDRLAPGEEVLPLFPLAFRDEAGRGRTLFAGLIPVARREVYFSASVERTSAALSPAQQQAARAAPTATVRADSKQARMTHFAMTVAEPWKNLIRASFAARESLTAAKPPGLSDSEPPEAQQERIFFHNMQSQMQSWLVLLDFADFLEKYLPDVWAVISGAPGSDVNALSTSQRRVYDWLGTASMTAALIAALRVPSTLNVPPAPDPLKPPATSLRDALAEIAKSDVRAGLERTVKLYGKATASDPDWPGFHFLLSGLDTGPQCAGAFTALSTLGTPVAGDNVDTDPRSEVTATPSQTATGQLDRLTALIARAMPAGPEADAPSLPFALQLRDALAATVGDPGSFVIRCVYNNRDCGPLHPPVLSAPTESFQLASFFDPDAPARPVRIVLPLDTTPAGLRKHNKNTAFVISDVLCGQIQRAKGLGLGDLVRSVLPWPLHKDLDAGDAGVCRNDSEINIGMICSLSIPIITICALILLMIIVSLFDFIFRWLPYFVICFPVPKLGGKSPGGT